MYVDLNEMRNENLVVFCFNAKYVSKGRNCGKSRTVGTMNFNEEISEV